MDQFADNYPEIDREPPLVTDDDTLFSAAVVVTCIFIAGMCIIAAAVLK